MKTIASLPAFLVKRHLFELLKNGDPSAMDFIYQRYHRRIYWIGRQMLRDEFAVETLVQDAFLKLWANREAIEDPGHLFFFLRFVMKRDCISYYTRPRNRFFRTVQSLERFENYQDYLAGYDPQQDAEQLREQARDEQALAQVKRVLPLLPPKRRLLIEACLQYGFRYKPIAQAMGTSVADMSHEVKRAIEDIRSIVRGSELLPEETKPCPSSGRCRCELTEQQAAILEMRCGQKHSFAEIASALGVTEKEAHREFVKAYALSHPNPTV